MNVFDRLKKIRKYRELSQEECAKWFSVTKQGYGKKEKGFAGMNLKELQLFLEKTQIDPRYLFGLTDDIEEADLLKHPQKSIAEELKEMKEAIASKIPVNLKDDDILSRVANNETLYNLVEMIYLLPGNHLREIQALIYGFLGKGKFEKPKKEKKAAGQ